ncbi:MAG: histidine kinase [Bacteroidota bacterium]|nr:histidine kinase [Bacteroidota bacterium]
MPKTENILIQFYIGGTLFVFLLLVFLLIYVYLHQMKVNRFKLQLNEQEIKKQEALFLALIEGEEKERHRLAEELHDGIGVKLSGLKMSVEYLIDYYSNSHKNLDKISSEPHPVSQGGVSLLSKVAEGMNESILELREISQNLKPSFLTNKGLVMVLTELVAHLNNKGNCRFKLYIEPDEEKFSRYMQVIYRIVSELLNNIQKHSQATEASAQVICSDNIIQIIAEDNGKGFDEKILGDGIGLTNIRSRLEIYNGRLNIESTDHGTVIIAELPLSKSE